MGTFVRRVRTKSGATAVQIVHKRRRWILSMEHIGSANDEVELAQAAHEGIHTGQEVLPLGRSSNGLAEAIIIWSLVRGVVDGAGGCVSDTRLHGGVKGWKQQCWS